MLTLLYLISSDWRRYLIFHKKINIFFAIAAFFHNPGMFFSLIYRTERYLFTHTFIFLRCVGYLLYPFYFLLTYYVLDINIAPSVQIGKGLYVHNKGIIVGDTVKAGEQLSLFGPITIGVKMIGAEKSARIGNGVTIYSGARVIGDVKIGDGAVIGANAVVVKNIPARVAVAGVPAKIIKSL